MIEVEGPVLIEEIRPEDIKREVFWVDQSNNAWKGTLKGAAVEAGIIFLFFPEEVVKQLGLPSNYAGVPARDAFWAI